MTRLEQLTSIYIQLDELYTRYYMARRTKDKRKRDKAIRDAKNDISNYSAFIPLDIKSIFDKEVGANSLNYQNADDIGQCIDIIEKLIKEEKSNNLRKLFE